MQAKKEKRKKQPGEIWTWPFMKKLEDDRWQVDARTREGGQRRIFETRVEANAWRQAQLTRRQNEGGAAFDGRELSQHGWTIQDAIRFALEHLRKQEASVTIQEAADTLISTKKAAGRSVRYCNDLRLRLTRLAGHFGERSISSISTGDLEDFLALLNVQPGTRNTFRRDCRTLWSLADKRGWATASVVKNTERAKADSKPPGILTPKQAERLLNESNDPDLLAFHAIGLFAGLRVKEIKALDWRNVNFEGGFIEVSAAVSKTRSRRLAPLLPNLRAWLEPIRKAEGLVVSREVRTLHENARRKLGFGGRGGETDAEKKKGVKLEAWPENAIRHSFVSYRLAETQDAGKTALESGHHQAVLFGHYREVVTQSQGAEYFGIYPKA